METAVSAPELQLRPGGGRSNGVRPSLSSACDTCGAVVLPAGVGAPRNFVAPHTCGELSCQAGRCISIARLLRPDLTWNYIRGLPSTSTCSCRAACGDASFHR